jgi:hypothetical protein
VQPLERNLTGKETASQPVFFFDGAFRTWPQVEQRALINQAIAAYVASVPGR